MQTEARHESRVGPQILPAADAASEPSTTHLSRHRARRSRLCLSETQPAGLPRRRQIAAVGAHSSNVARRRSERRIRLQDGAGACWRRLGGDRSSEETTRPRHLLHSSACTRHVWCIALDPELYRGIKCLIEIHQRTPRKSCRSCSQVVMIDVLRRAGADVTVASVEDSLQVHFGCVQSIMWSIVCVL